MNPDDLPLNYFDKAYKDIMKNNLDENQNEKLTIIEIKLIFPENKIKRHLLLGRNFIPAEGELQGITLDNILKRRGKR